MTLSCPFGGTPRLSVAGEVVHRDALLAEVDGRPITLFMVMRETGPLEMELARRLPLEEYNRRVAQLRSASLEEIINRKLAYVQFLEREERLPEAHFQRQIDDVVRREAGGDLEAFEQTLEAQGMNLQDFRRQVRQQMAIQAIMDERVRRAVEVTERDIREYYREHKDEFVEPEEVKIRSLFISSRRSGPQNQFQQHFQEAYRRLQRGEDFELIGLALASRTDLLQSQWVKLSELPSSLARVARSLPLRHVSSPINTREGVYFILLEDKRGEHTVAFSEVRDTIERMLYRRRTLQKRDELMRELQDKFHVRIFQ